MLHKVGGAGVDRQHREGQGAGGGADCRYDGGKDPMPVPQEGTWGGQ